MKTNILTMSTLESILPQYVESGCGIYVLCIKHPENILGSGSIYTPEKDVFFEDSEPNVNFDIWYYEDDYISSELEILKQREREHSKHFNFAPPVGFLNKFEIYTVISNNDVKYLTSSTSSNISGILSKLKSVLSETSNCIVFVSRTRDLITPEYFPRFANILRDPTSGSVLWDFFQPGFPSVVEELVIDKVKIRVDVYDT